MPILQRKFAMSSTDWPNKANIVFDFNALLYQIMSSPPSRRFESPAIHPERETSDSIKLPTGLIAGVVRSLNYSNQLTFLLIELMVYSATAMLSSPRRSQ